MLLSLVSTESVNHKEPCAIVINMELGRINFIAMENDDV